MQEIKFRAWNKLHNKMSGEFNFQGIFGDINGEYKGINDINGNTVDIVENHEEVFTDDMNIIMQYTGLKDKKGVDIYEGDILIFDTGIKRDIGYFGNMFRPRDISDNEWWIYGEIVGNIYENNKTN